MIAAPARTVEQPHVAVADDASCRRRGRIGLIVTGSVAAGLVGAVALVAGPLAGAAEHLISGSVLLAFAVAWTALAVLSQRWTSQPQRWAYVPAAAMASAGGSMVIFPATNNNLRWIWPPVLVALVAWMIVRVRRDLVSAARRLVLYPVFGTLLLAAFGGGYEVVGETTHAGEPAITGRLIDVGGYRLHLECIGTGSPTVVLEAGLGQPAADIAGWIAPEVASTTRVCAYDRPGLGRSESAPNAQSADAIAIQLHTLLTRAGEQGPYVLAGHSAGGLYAMVFARLYHQQVAGLVLLDSTHPYQYSKVAGYPAFYKNYRRVSGILPSLARVGVGRAVASFGNLYATIPPTARAAARSSMASPRSWRSLRDELSRLPTSMREAQALQSLGNRPLVVVTAVVAASPEWMGLQENLLALSTNSAHVVLPTANHEMVTEDEANARQSAKAIRDVVDAARTGAAVAGSDGSSHGDAAPSSSAQP